MAKNDGPTEDEVRRLFGKIVANSGVKALNYAVPYAKEGMRMSGDYLACQIPYVLSNMTGWRGETAKQVREGLKAFKR